MKQVELNLHKRLLIVEFEDMDHLENVISCGKQGIRFCSDDKKLVGLICKGSELTEEVAEDLVDIFDLSYYVHYNGHNRRSYKLTALDSFISAIEAQGYYWGENPVIFDDNEIDFNKRYEIRINWEKAESRTFNPEKTLIFEIL